MKNTAILKRPWPALAVLAAIALGGCSGANVGSSWQCPLAQGGTCDSVADADPAVPAAGSDPKAARKPVLGEPLYRVRGGGPAEAAAPSCQAGCGFDPFGWLARLFGADRKDAASPKPKPAPTAAAKPESTTELPTQSTALPGEPELADDDLRTEEVVARIWIAPFVDANGVYREASHVRAVLEPAGWRVP